MRRVVAMARAVVDVADERCHAAAEAGLMCHASLLQVGWRKGEGQG